MKKSDSSDYEISNFCENDSSFQNSQCIKKQKKLKLKLKKERIYKQKNHGSWNNNEEKKFVTHMKLNREIFQDKESRRSNKIFRQMAKYIGTRSSEQCRSHHQKYQLRFCNFDNIITHIESKINESLQKDNLRAQEQIQLNNWKASMAKYIYLNQRQSFIGCINTVNDQKCNTNKSAECKVEKEQQNTIASSTDLILAEGKGYQVFRKTGTRLELKIQINFQLFLQN